MMASTAFQKLSFKKPMVKSQPANQEKAVKP